MYLTLDDMIACKCKMWSTTNRDQFHIKKKRGEKKTPTELNRNL